MTLNQIVMAYAHINELSKLVLPYRTTRDLLRLKKRLKEEFDTVLSMESALVEAHGGTQNEDGSYRFSNPHDQKQFAAEYNELMVQDQDIHLPVVNLSRYTDLIRISPAAMEALDVVIAFEEIAETKAGDP